VFRRSKGDVESINLACPTTVDRLDPPVYEADADLFES
jgi:hypothetical protein